MKFTSLFMVLALPMVVAACGPQPPAGSDIDPADLQPSGTVEINQRTAALVVGGSGGTGVLYYQGQSYPFEIGGVGFGGIGYTELQATGEVYNLYALEDFEGTYGQARVGLTAGTGEGQQWLQNTSGVYLELRTQTSGLALNAGLDGMIVSFPD